MQRADGTPMNHEETLDVIYLRLNGCRCHPPTLGYQPHVGPRCEICSTQAVVKSPRIPDIRQRQQEKGLIR